MYMNTTTESSKGGTLIYLDKNLKYKLRKDLNIYHKGMIESTFVKIINKNKKNVVAGCIYKHPKQFQTFWITTYCLFYKNYLMKISKF